MRWPDDTLRLLRDGYLFGERGFERSGAPTFRTRLLGRSVTVMRGLDAARFFYEDGRFDRSPGSVPRSAVHLLQDAGSVQTLEGARHASRKKLLIGLLDDRPAIVSRFRECWMRRAQVARDPVSLLEVTSGALSDAVCAWAGIEAGVFEPEDFTSMVDNAGLVGPPNWAARVRRALTERRAQELIREARATPPVDTALSRLAHAGDDGGVIPTQVRAVELLNLLRPTVAVARFIVFAALALHDHPELHAPVASHPDARRAFAQEVRRFFPFFPMIGGHATRDVVFGDQDLPAGSWVMLDLYGTDHDPSIWPEPHRFEPRRFSGATQPVVAQGIGDVATTHHCPGVPATAELIEAGVDLLVNGPAYRVPEQDLRVSLRRFPAKPADGFVVEFA